MQIKFIFVAIFAMVSSVASAQSMSATDAQSLGSSVGASLNNSTAAGVTDANAMNTVPGYTSTPPANLASSLGSNSLNALGASQNTQCDQAGFVKGGTVANQECNASVTLRKNTNYGQMSASQMPQPSTTFTASSILGSSTSTSFCQSYATPGGTVVNTQTCSESLKSYTSTCTKKYSPTLGLATQGFSENPGYNVSPWSAQTFNYQVNINGIPNTVVLASYQADNYGQLWVNGQIVIQNILGGMTDMRNGWVGYRTETTCSYDWDSGSQYCYDYQAGPYFFNGDGSYTGFYDDNCNWGCRGVSPGTNITSYFQPGVNNITLVCANANNYGGCGFNMSMQANTINPVAWVDGCTPQEALQ